MGCFFDRFIENISFCSKIGIIEKSISFPKKEYRKKDQRHQWGHIEAVMRRALEIAEQLDDVDYELLKLAVIFHDIDYNSEASYEENYRNHVENSVKVAQDFLKRNNYPRARIERLKQVMLDHSTPYRRKFGESIVKEGKILYDADKSLFLTTPERIERYSALLYFDETRKLVRKPDGKSGSTCQ